MRHSVFVGTFCLITLSPLSAAAQLPQPPEEWWAGLAEGGEFPSATVQMETGATMTYEFSIRAIEGSEITLVTRGSAMGTAIPEQVRTLDAKDFDPNAPDAARASMGPAAVPTGAGEGLQKVEDTTCTVGELELACAVYEIRRGAVTIRIWHSPSIPPVFMNGIVRSETSAGGITQTTVMTEYRGRLLDS